MKLSICSCVKFLSAGTDKHFAATVCTAMESKRYTCGHFEVMHMSCDHLIQLQGVLAALLNCPNLLLASIRHKTGGKVTAKLSTGLSAATNTITSHPPAQPSSHPISHQDHFRITLAGLTQFPTCQCQASFFTVNPPNHTETYTRTQTRQ